MRFSLHLITAIFLTSNRRFSHTYLHPCVAKSHTHTHTHTQMLVDIFYRRIYFGSLLIGVSPHLPQRTQNPFRQISKCKTWLSDWMASAVSSWRRRAPVCFVWILNAFHIFSMGFGFPAKSKYYRAWQSGDPNLLLGVNECVNVIVCVLAWDRPELSPCVSLSSAWCMLAQSVLLKEEKNERWAVCKAVLWTLIWWTH